MDSSSRFPNINETEDHSHLPHVSEDKRETVYQGRAVIPFTYSLNSVSQPPSFLNRMMDAWSTIFEMDVTNILAAMPKGFVKMVRLMDAKLDEMQHPPKQELSPFLLFLLGRKGPTVEEELAQEEENEKTRNMIEEKLEEAIHQLGTQREEQLKLAKVSSMREFREKQDMVGSYRMEAEKCYLETASHVETRKEIDRQMITAYKGVLSQEDQATIENYWNYVTHDPQGRAQRESIEARASAIFSKSAGGIMDEMAEEMQKLMSEGSIVKPCQFMTNYFHGIAQKTSQELIQERQQCQTAGGKLVIDYLLLTEGCKISTLLNRMLRMVLQSELEKANRNADNWIDYEQKSHQDLVIYLNDYLERSKKRIIEEQERYASTDLEYMKELYLKSIAMKETAIQETEAHLEQLQKKTEENFKKAAYTRMKESFGQETPPEIRALIPKQTAFDKLMLEVMNLEAGGQLSQSLQSLQSSAALTATPDLQLDLTQLSNPVDYFCQQIGKKDQQKLQLFHLFNLRV